MYMDGEATGAPKGKIDYDRQELARLARIALRGRRIKDAAEEMDLSVSIVSKLTRGDSESCPTVNTLRKLNAGNPPELLRRMLEVCKHPLNVRDEMDAYTRMIKDTPGRQDVRADQTLWNSNIALAMVVESLTAEGYGTRFLIDYRTDGLFAIDLGEEKPLLVCLALVLPDPEIQPKKAVKQALEKIEQGIRQWGVKDTAFMVLTDSVSMYQLLKQMPNRSKVMAVAVTSEERSCIARQYTILPMEPSTDKPGKFPVDLSIFGDELMMDI